MASAAAASDPRTMLEQALDQTESIIAAIKPDQLTEPTPCDDYDVRGLIAHLVAAIERCARVGESGIPGELSAPEGGTAGELLALYRTAGTRARAAWADDARLDAMVEVPWGKVPGRGAVAGYTMEVVAHGWDLATATGQPAERDPQLGAAMLAMAEQVLPEHPRGGDIPFGPVVPAPPGAGTYTRLAGWLGRRVSAP